MSLPEAGTNVRAKVLGYDEAKQNNKDPYPEPEIPTLEGAPEFVEGPLEVHDVKAPWGDYKRYQVGEWDIDPVTVVARGREPDAPREPHGQFAPGGGGSKLGATSSWSVYGHPVAGPAKGIAKQKDWWRESSLVAGLFASSGQKEIVVKTLTAASGLSYKRTNELVASWASTSSDSHPESLALQEAVANKFGIPIGAGLRAEIARVAAAKTSYLAFDEQGHTLSWADRQADAAKFVNAMYDTTQAKLKAGGITEMYLCRGMQFQDGDLVPKGLKDVEGKRAGAETTVRSHPASSWSLDSGIASSFAHAPVNPFNAPGKSRGFVLSARVPADRILSTPFTGVGCLNETEVVIVGGNKMQVFAEKV